MARVKTQKTSSIFLGLAVQSVMKRRLATYRPLEVTKNMVENASKQKDMGFISKRIQ